MKNAGPGPARPIDPHWFDMHRRCVNKLVYTPQTQTAISVSSRFIFPLVNLLLAFLHDLVLKQLISKKSVAKYTKSIIRNKVHQKL